MNWVLKKHTSKSFETKCSNHQRGQYLLFLESAELREGRIRNLKVGASVVAPCNMPYSFKLLLPPQKSHFRLKNWVCITCSSISREGVQKVCT